MFAQRRTQVLLLRTTVVHHYKALEMLDVIQFRPPEGTMAYSQVVANVKCSMLAEEILRSSVSEKNGVYHYSERGDRLINLESFRDKLC
ncbi:nuclear pore complex protein NUP205-like isoform X2 [Silene latifolia]|uniref:nuclear pore complex protein NUP205-like isoform X2 n=1 Tax=Silene latifolia TaxID=37657 RepID=UPI003D781A66